MNNLVNVLYIAKLTKSVSDTTKHIIEQKKNRICIFQLDAVRQYYSRTFGILEREKIEKRNLPYLDTTPNWI